MPGIGGWSITRSDEAFSPRRSNGGQRHAAHRVSMGQTRECATHFVIVTGPPLQSLPIIVFFMIL